LLLIVNCLFVNCFIQNKIMKYLKYTLCLFASILLHYQPASSQHKSLVNTSGSNFASLNSINMEDVTWTTGFWAERFQVCKKSMVPNILATYMNAEVSHAYKNFEIAAGLDSGKHKGPPFHDGDFYKVLESVASLYALTKDKRLDERMDAVIAVIAKTQREDGYIHTPVIIQERKNSAKAKAFEDRLNFETYNMGHLMTAACIHFRATGKKSLLNIAIKATDYLNNFYKRSSPELARNAICPSHYMGVVEMYRTTKNPAYLELAKNLINIRGFVDNGTDDNQDRIPFRQQTAAMGHAVRANYLYAGVADVYAETGEDSLLTCLKMIWDDVVHKKMYVTGACGALYDGVSPYGTSYNPTEIQKTHQAFGRAYQLPNMTAHNETCANIGNVLWNWRMLQITGQAKYADVLELALYNSVLSGISLDGNKFFYTNPLSHSDEFPYKLRWSGGRVEYISLSNCCPPNTVRTISEVSNYLYSVSAKGLWFNLYGANTLTTKLKDGSPIALTQETNYPWDGNIKITLTKAPKKDVSLFLRIPGWSKNARISVNGKVRNVPVIPGEYSELPGKWSAGDVIELNLPMTATLLEANPLVEETRNQVAVKRGPVVYCLESADLAGTDVFAIAIPTSITLKTRMIKIEDSNILSLEGEAKLIENSGWKDQLYKEVSPVELRSVPIRLIPYFAWGNRGSSDMTIWMPLNR
jgi:uncharacterized protein